MSWSEVSHIVISLLRSHCPHYDPHMSARSAAHRAVPLDGTDVQALEDALTKMEQLVEHAWKDGYARGRGMGRFDSAVDEAWDSSIAKRIQTQLTVKTRHLRPGRGRVGVSEEPHEEVGKDGGGGGASE